MIKNWNTYPVPVTDFPGGDEQLVLRRIGDTLNNFVGAVDVDALDPVGSGSSGLRINGDNGALLTQNADLFQTKDSVETVLGAGTKNLLLTNWRSTAVTNGAGLLVSTGETYIQSISITNPHSAVVFVKLYNLASVTPASSVPIDVYACPAGDSRWFEFQRPLRYSSYVAIRSVTGAGDTNDTAPLTTTIVSLRIK